MTPRERLAPCPFCGREAVLSRHPKGYDLAHCSDDTCDPGHLTFAVPEKWNRRAPSDAARAQALEEAARTIEPRHPPDDWTEYAKITARCAENIRALSPLPPGSRVVVIPPEGSAEWEALVARTAKNIRKEDKHERLTLIFDARAALRALTGGDDRE